MSDHPTRIQSFPLDDSTGSTRRRRYVESSKLGFNWPTPTWLGLAGGGKPTINTSMLSPSKYIVNP